MIIDKIPAPRSESRAGGDTRLRGLVLATEGSLLKAPERVYGSIHALGSLCINGSAATLDTTVTPCAAILTIPKVEAGTGRV